MTIDIRDAFFHEISNYALNDPNVVIVTGDMEVLALLEFKTKHPERFINSGTSEQNMVNIAAGLASCGKKVIILGILSFISTRSFEQIKLNICGMKLPVIIAGIGPGLSFSFDGPTHHATSDISSMRQMPELRILNPCDELTASNSAKLALNFSSPSYVRIDKGKFPKICHDDSIMKKAGSELFQIEKGRKKLIIFTGTVLDNVRLIHEELKNNHEEIGIICVVQIYPVPNELILILAEAKEIIIVEENTLSGGLFNLISEIVAINNLSVSIKFVLLRNEQIFRYGDRKWLTSEFQSKS